MGRGINIGHVFSWTGMHNRHKKWRWPLDKLTKLVIMDSVSSKQKPSLIDLQSTNVSMKLSYNRNPMFSNIKFYVDYKPITN